MMVRLAQGLVFRVAILNRLDVDGAVETLPVVLQSVGEVTEQNADKLIWGNTGSSVDTV